DRTEHVGVVAVVRHAPVVWSWGSAVCSSDGGAFGRADAINRGAGRIGAAVELREDRIVVEVVVLRNRTEPEAIRLAGVSGERERSEERRVGEEWRTRCCPDK